ncbi:hypothetical protein BCR34DRAFT_254955 [Clohesyomyces aquaticus]|uniref:Uncharacterized protein n=1 Tax=Clohesyomyces aquaticus TaxID=1231657 RepID=A0A1Y1ZTX1_9PLEO|nr:hypothetical protein BCR34DRAFT_254955 [Clohesyomyces aquaticus]
MSSLKIEPSFSTQASYRVAAGLADLNTSTALSMSPTWATALLFDIGSPLWDSRNSIQMKPLDTRFGRCHSTSDATRYTPCEESYLLTGGCLRITPQKDDLRKHPDATIYVVADTKSYQVEFDDVHDQSELRSQGHCKTHGYPIGAIHTCIALGKSQEIQHGYGVCPQALMASGRCLTNTSWIKDPFPYASSLYVYRRTATVYYSRSNFSIVAVKDLSDPDPFLVRAEDLSVISDVVMRSLNFRNANSSDTTSSDLAVFMSAGLQKLDNPFVLRLARTEGRKALATMLQYFHANHVGAGGPESVWEALEPRPGLPPDMYTTLQIAVPSYHVVASSLTLYIFIGVSSALLLLCFTTIIFTCGTVTRWPWRTGYPALDFAIYCLPTRVRHHRNLYKTLASMRERQNASIGKSFEGSRFYAN